MEAMQEEELGTKRRWLQNGAALLEAQESINQKAVEFHVIFESIQDFPSSEGMHEAIRIQERTFQTISKSLHDRHLAIQTNRCLYTDQEVQYRTSMEDANHRAILKMIKYKAATQVLRNTAALQRRRRCAPKSRQRLGRITYNLPHLDTLGPGLFLDKR